MARFIAYRPRVVGELLRARVVKDHRNGWLSVEPWWWMNEAGEDVGTFQGGDRQLLRTTDVVLCLLPRGEI